MQILHISLFGRFQAGDGKQTHIDLETRKVQELFCYLLLHRERAHSREFLAALLWGDCPTAQAKKNFRQALWHLQSGLDPRQFTLSEIPVLLVEPEWIRINPAAGLRLDVAVFEQAYASAQLVRGRKLDAAQAQALQEAVGLYQDDLLVGWYQDWCLYERERLQQLYLMMLDKLMSYCEERKEFETGLAYGTTILRFDSARERTHRRLMRLYYLAGDRTAALRQYEQCSKALDVELGVQPSERTRNLYNQICGERRRTIPATTSADAAPPPIPTAVPELLTDLKQLHAALTGVLHQMQQDIQAIEKLFARDP